MTDELYYDAVDLLQRLIATPSVSRKEKDAADVVEEFMRGCGYRPRRHGNNVWITGPGYDPSRPTLLLNSHIDTVKPVAGWQHDPFTPTAGDGERLYGLGSNDAGASLVSLIAAFRYLEPRPQHYNLVMLASCEEEVSGAGGIESVLPMGSPRRRGHRWANPPGMRPAIAEKGLMVLDGTVTGKSGHAARGEGINAIYRAIGTIDTLRRARTARRCRPHSARYGSRSPRSTQAHSTMWFPTVAA